MCDYSLHHVKSRPAKVGDKLTTTDFNTGTRGFAAPEDSTTAVCTLPGTELAFSEEVKCVPFRLGWKEYGPPQRYPRPNGSYDTLRPFSRPVPAQNSVRAAFDRNLVVSKCARCRG